MNKNVVATITLNDNKNVLLNVSMIKFQSKDHIIGTYEINKISLSGFDDKNPNSDQKQRI